MRGFTPSSIASRFPSKGAAFSGWGKGGSLFLPSVDIPITTYSSGAHPHSYQAPVTCRNQSYWFYCKRTSSNLEIWRRHYLSDTFSLASTIGIGLGSTGEGDVGSIACNSSGHLIAVYLVSTGTYNIERRTSTDNGATWSSADTVVSGSSWGTNTVSNPCLHIATDNTQHIAYAGASNNPYHGYWNGSTWVLTQVASNGSASLRPFVVTSSTGRVVVSYTNSSTQAGVYYSDTNGTSWTAATPTTTNQGTLLNIRMTIGNGTILLSGQRTDSRSVIYNECTASSMSWGSWEIIKDTTGADCTMFYDSLGFKNAVYRYYNGTAGAVYWATKASGSWVETQIGNNVAHILPASFAPCYHRFSTMPYNKPWLIMPESGGNINFRFIPSINLAA